MIANPNRSARNTELLFLKNKVTGHKISCIMDKIVYSSNIFFVIKNLYKLYRSSLYNRIP